MKTTAVAILSLIAGISAVPVPEPSPPGVPSSSTAKTLLAGLKIATPVDDGMYKRTNFKTWDTIEGRCNTRDEVLKRDGTGVQTNDACTITAGTWVSPYDNITFTVGHDLDIDHLVPLKNAWISGASKWEAKQRETFANDLSRPQLYAVSEHANRQKGDKGPDEWKPPVASFECQYAESWVVVKDHYQLTVSNAEKNALSQMLDTC